MMNFQPLQAQPWPSTQRGKAATIWESWHGPMWLQWGTGRQASHPAYMSVRLQEPCTLRIFIHEGSHRANDTPCSALGTRRTEEVRHEPTNLCAPVLLTFPTKAHPHFLSGALEQ